MKKSQIWLSVFSLLVIILAVVFASRLYAAKREQAAQQVCLSNLKCSALAILMYVQDYDGCFPVVTPGKEDAWAIPVAPYFHSVAERWCPRDARYEKRGIIRSNPKDPADAFRRIRQRVGACSSYVMNAKLSGIKLDSLKQPHDMILLEEKPAHHKGYHLVAYADGHATAMQVSSVGSRVPGKIE